MLSRTDREHLKAALETLDKGQAVARCHIAAVLDADSRHRRPKRRTIPTDEQACQVYRNATNCSCGNRTPGEWMAMAHEVRVALLAGSASKAGERIPIRWEWFADYMPAEFCARLRREWRRMQGAKP